MLSADRIFFPTPRFVNIFEAAGKSTFPNGITYKVRRSRVVEEALFQFLACPHPRTRIYFGRQKKSIPGHFSFPLLVMGPDKSCTARAVSSPAELEEWTVRCNPLIVQENVHYEARFRMTFVNCGFLGIERIVASKTNRESSADQFAGCSVENLIRDASQIVKSAGLNDIAVEAGIGQNGWFIIGFVRPPMFCPTPGGMVNRHEYITALIEKGIL